MKFIDTHCHIYLEEFRPDREEVIRNAKEVGISKIILPNIDSSSLPELLNVCGKNPGFAYPMIGLHPTNVDADYVGELAILEKQIDKYPFNAIGEIGIDLYWDKTYLKEQKTVFIEQLQWSKANNLPVSIHSRDAMNEVLECIYAVGPEKLKGVFHSFTGSANELKEIRKLNGFYIGINGVVTFKNSNLSSIIHQNDLGRIVLETDAPYLSPVPFRGKRNEPFYIVYTARKIAEAIGENIETVALQTTKNAENLFRIC